MPKIYKPDRQGQLLCERETINLNQNIIYIYSCVFRDLSPPKSSGRFMAWKRIFPSTSQSVALGHFLAGASHPLPLSHLCLRAPRSYTAAIRRASPQEVITKHQAHIFVSFLLARKCRFSLYSVARLDPKLLLRLTILDTIAINTLSPKISSLP